MSSSGPRVKQKRRQFSLKEKVDILTELSNGKKQVDLCRERDIAPSTVATILKDCDKIMKLHQKSQLAPSRKRLRLGDFQEATSCATGRLLVQRLLINIRLKLPTEVNIRQAAEMLTGSWWSVKASTISNCWRRAGLFKTSPVPQESEDREEVNPELWDELTEKLPLDTAVTFDDYVDCDSAAATSAELTTEDIVNQVRGQEQCDDEDDAEDADTVSTHEEEATVSSSDALVSIEKICLFLGHCEDVPDDVHKKVEDVESFVLQRLSSTRQKKITDFFKQ